MTPSHGDLVIGKWGARYLGRNLPCAIGRGGIGRKRGEGDGVSPIGIFHVKAVRFRPDRMPAPRACVPTKPISPFDIWSDDPNDPHYNHGLTAWNHPFSHESLRRSDSLYDALAILDFNWPSATPGKGSAIFLHIWRKSRHPTEGCIAFSKRDFLWILSTWQIQSRVFIQP